MVLIQLAGQGRFALPLLLACLLGAGCIAVRTGYEYPADLYSPDYVRRSLAVAQFAREQDASQLPEAFVLLDDDEADVRLMAYVTIRGMSPGGEDFGYAPWLTEPVRSGVVARWEAWWVKSRAPEAQRG